MVNDSVFQLVQDISHATFRVASVVEFPQLGKELKGAAVDLVSDPDSDSLGRLERLVLLGKAVDEIGTVNADVLLRELNNLRGLMVKGDPVSKVEMDIARFFKGKGNELPFNRKEGGNRVNKRKISSGPGKRQTEILNFIRQFPNGCRATDISRNFDDVSKRTIRNDIGVLLDRGEVERVGNGGPYSYIRALAPQSVVFGATGDQDDGGKVILLREPREGEEALFD